MPRLTIAAVPALALLLASGAAPASAQSQDPDTSIRLNLSPPGARSLGLGGAFVGLADDATAAYTNPAGLTNLTLGGSEVAVEVRHWQFDNSHLDRGRGSDFGEPTGNGVDTVAGLERAEASSDVSGLSFLSYGWVLPRGLTLAFYRHELVRFETGFATQGPFGGLRATPRRSRTDLEVLNYGISGAYEIELPPLGRLESRLSLGLGLSYFQLDLSARNDHYGFSDLSSQPGGFFGLPDYLDDNLLYFQEQTADEDDFGFNVGWLWKLGRSQSWSVGGVFRKGAEFETSFTTAVGPFGPFRLLQGLTVPETGVLHIPDSMALGVAFRAADGKTRLALDVSRTRYSQRLVDYTLSLTRSRDLILDLPLPPEVLALYSESGFEEYLAGFNIDDSDEIHLGLERVFLVVESLFVGTARFGVWHEPFHELEYLGDDSFTKALLERPKGGDTHYSAGIGLVIKEDYQIDLAADFSDVTNTISISLVKFL